MQPCIYFQYYQYIIIVDIHTLENRSHLLNKIWKLRNPGEMEEWWEGKNVALTSSMWPRGAPSAWTVNKHSWSIK